MIYLQKCCMNISIWLDLSKKINHLIYTLSHLLESCWFRAFTTLYTAKFLCWNTMITQDTDQWLKELFNCNVSTQNRVLVSTNLSQSFVTQIKNSWNFINNSDDNSDNHMKNFSLNESDEEYWANHQWERQHQLQRLSKIQ